MTTSSDAAPVAAWVPDWTTFGARLALVRHHMGWNVKEAALACNISQGAWRGWELDGNRPRDLVDVCRKISDRTGASYDWLLDGRTPPGISAWYSRADRGSSLRVTFPAREPAFCDVAA